MNPARTNQERKQQRWQLLFFVLAAVEVATITGSLALNHKLTSMLAATAAVNQTWSIRRDAYANLASLATDVNMPGIDVFDSRDAAGESERQQQALLRFDRAINDARQELVSGIGVDQGASLLTGLETIETAMAEMTGVQQQIFRDVQEGEIDGACAKLAVMNDADAAVSAAIRAMGMDVHARQQAHFDRQTAFANSLEKMQYAIAGVIVLIVVTITVYGYTIACQFKRSAARLAKSKERFALAVAGSRDGIWDWDLASGRVYYAPQWKALLGLQDDDISACTDEWFGRIASKDLPKFHEAMNAHIRGEIEQLDHEMRMLHADGSTKWMLCRAVAVRDESGRATRLAGSLADITELKNVQEKLRRLAQHDRLTDLPNRAYFTARLREAVSRHREDPGAKFAVLFFDFDRFKLVNDSFGHTAGDALLVSIADRFRGNLREGDTAARFGGDEFVILLRNVEGAEVGRECDRLLAAFAEPHAIDGHEVVSTASIGVVTSEHAQGSAEAVTFAVRDPVRASTNRDECGTVRYRGSPFRVRPTGRNPCPAARHARSADRGRSAGYRTIPPNRQGWTGRCAAPRTTHRRVRNARHPGQRHARPKSSASLRPY